MAKKKDIMPLKNIVKDKDAETENVSAISGINKRPQTEGKPKDNKTIGIKDKTSAGQAGKTSGKQSTAKKGTVKQGTAKKGTVKQSFKKSSKTGKKPTKSLTNKKIKDQTGDKSKPPEQLIIDEELVQEKLQEAEKLEQPETKKKSKITSTLFLIFNVVFLAFIIPAFLGSTGGSSFKDLAAVQGNRLWWMAAACGIFIIIMLADTAKFTLLIFKTTGKFRPFLSYKTSAIGKYYESITPLGVGGQPSQVYYMAKRGVSPGVATSLPIVRFIISNLVDFMIALTMFILIVPTLTSTSPLNSIFLAILKILAYVGVIISFLKIFLVILIGSSKIVGRSVARWFLRIGYKLRLVKNYRESYDKLMGQVVEFHNSMTYLKRNLGTLVGLLFYSLIEVLAIISLPFIACLAFTDITFVTAAEGFTFWLDTVARFYVCAMASSFIPIPGGVGMMEISFLALFGNKNLLGPINVIWGFLLWRIISYYILILQGIFIGVGDTIFNVGKRNKKAVKKLQSQSRKGLVTANDGKD